MENNNETSNKGLNERKGNKADFTELNAFPLFDPKNVIFSVNGLIPTS